MRPAFRIQQWLLVALVPIAAGCAFLSPAAPHKSVQFAEAPSPHDASDPYPNWSIPPAMTFEELHITQYYEFDVLERSVQDTAGGTSGAYEVLVAFPGLGATVKYKGKQVPPDLDGINNAPRKELAAFAIQRLFFEPEDYVAPTNFIICIPLERWNELHMTQAKPTLAGSNCVLTNISLWLEDLTLPDQVYDEERFLSDSSYAHFMSNLNVFTYLINHRDGRDGNFLVSKNDARRQVFAIDNGSTFSGAFYNYFVPNWNVIRVAAVRKETIDRLRKLKREDLDYLAVVSQGEIQFDRSVLLVHPSPPIDEDEGTRVRDKTVQFGLTRDEIDAIWERIGRLLAKVDAGDLPVF